MSGNGKAVTAGVIVLLFVFAVGLRADTLRVGLTSHFAEVPLVVVTATSPFVVTDQSGAKIVDVDGVQQTTLRRDESAIHIISGCVSTDASEVSIASSDSGGVITISIPKGFSARYRGSITAKLGAKGLNLVNVVDLEDYCRGVLPSEMPSEFNIEALKAQAVAARTYAWSTRGKHRKEGFDLCDGTHCQIYAGLDKESSRCTKAVKDTSGLVATYQGKLISALYSSDCGGTTECGDKPYLCSISDRPEGGDADYCAREGHAWTASWTIADLEAKLQKPYPELKGLRGVSVNKTDQSNRVDEIKIDADQDSATISGARFRMLLGSTVVKSTCFTAKTENGVVTLDGKGFGHGIGLCQFGANGLAKPPYSYTFDQILKHYYTAIDIVPLAALSATDD